MKVAIKDPAALGALKPLELVAYLRAKGWRKEVEFDNGSLWFWQSEQGVEYDVTLPAKRELGDYVLRIAEVLYTLSAAEGRSGLDVLRDIQLLQIPAIKEGSN